MGANRAAAVLPAAAHVLQLLLLLLLPQLRAGTTVAATENLLPQHSNPYLHVVALVGEAEVTLRHFLHSACRLGFPSVEVVRGWNRCARKGCEAISRLKEHLRALPRDDLVIVSNLGDEYVYLMGRYDDAQRRVAETGDRLLVAVFPLQGERKGEGEAQSNQKQDDTQQTVRENKEREKQTEIEKKLKNMRKITSTANHDKETQDETKDKRDDNERDVKGRDGETELEEEARHANTIGEPEYPSTSGDGEIDGEGGAAMETRHASKGRQDGEEEEMNEVLLYRAIRGGTVMGRVGTLLEALMNQGASPSIVQDKGGNHIVFDNDRSRGTMKLEVPLKVKFFPDSGSRTVPKAWDQEEGEEEREGEGVKKEQEEATEPFIVYNRNEEIDFHNVLEVAGAMEREEEICPYFLPRDTSEGPPRLLVNILLGGSWAPFLEEVLASLALQDYPKEFMDVWIYGKTGVQEAEISTFMEDNKRKYSSVTLELDQTPDHHLLMSRCAATNCSLVVLVEAGAALEDPSTLTLLVAADRPVVGPVLKQRQEGGEENFVVKKGEDISHWDDLIRSRSVRATLRVAEVQAVRIVHRDYLEDLLLGRQVEQYITTRARVGLLLDPRGYQENKLHSDLWGIRYNPLAWRRRYVHPDLHSIIRGETQAEEVGKDLYYVPLFTERFCRELVEELEHYGRWQDKDTDNRDESHRYTSTNINLSQIDFASEYHLVINTLHKELLATLYGGYRAHGRASLLFVLRYIAATDYNTFTYHLDGATYTMNVALNNDFTGGGLEYRLGNKRFGDEKEVMLAHNRTGWAVVQPDRPYHLHHGVPLLSGRRYALIAIVDTNDAGSKGGPLW